MPLRPSRSPRVPLSPATYRLVGYCLLVGVFGAFAALAFNAMVELAQRYLLSGIAGYVPPPPGVLNPEAVIPTFPRLWWLPVVTTLGGLVSGFIVYTWAPEAEGHGTDAAIAAYHRQGGEVRTRIPFIKAVASALTIGSGGVAGREGPTAQISVGLGAILGRVLRLRGQERRILILAGMAAGLAAVFRAPLGMAIFAVEILYSGMVFESEALIYTVIAAVSAYAIHGFFAGWLPIFVIPQGLDFHNPLNLLAYAVLGVAAGLLGAVVPACFYHVRDLFQRLPGPPHVKPALGGLIVGLVGMFVPEALGTGYGWVELALAGSLALPLMLRLLLVKVPLMSITIGSGGSGGVFAPTVVIGAMLGAVTGHLFQHLVPSAQVSPAGFVLVGMAAVFAGCARTPISTLIMVAEMTGGYALIVPTMLANVLSFMIQRTLTAGRKYPTLYESQVEGREDSPVHRGVFVRRAFDMIEGGALERSELTLPRLVSLLQYGQPIQVTGDSGMLVAVEVAPGCELDGHTIMESIGGVEGTTAVAVLRGGKMVVPRGPTRLDAGDQVIAVATPEAHERLLQLAGAAIPVPGIADSPR
jgi:chloride channel protein, CIC family